MATAAAARKTSALGNANSQALRNRRNGRPRTGEVRTAHEKNAYGNRKNPPAEERNLPATAEDLDKWHLPPEPPEGALGKTGRTFYAQYAAMQNDLAVHGKHWLTQGDYAALIAHCKSIDDFAATTKRYDEEEKRQKKAGEMVPNPYQNALHKCINLVMKTSKELGLTPEKAIRIRQEIAVKDWRENPAPSRLVAI